MSASIRPTRNRLLRSLALSACLVALMLSSLNLLEGFHPQVPNDRFDSENVLTVQIKNNESTISDDTDLIEDVVPVMPQETKQPEKNTERQPKLTPLVAIEPGSDPEPAIDWRALSKDVAVMGIAVKFDSEETRASMWRQSHSVMFQPGDEEIKMDEAPLLTDIHFIERSRVLGIGLNIGSCFIGIPIAGVDVEDRSAEISVFVCTGGS